MAMAAIDSFLSNDSFYSNNLTLHDTKMFKPQNDIDLTNLVDMQTNENVLTDSLNASGNPLEEVEVPLWRGNQMVVEMTQDEWEVEQELQSAEIFAKAYSAQDIIKKSMEGLRQKDGEGSKSKKKKSKKGSKEDSYWTFVIAQGFDEDFMEVLNEKIRECSEASAVKEAQLLKSSLQVVLDKSQEKNLSIVHDSNMDELPDGMDVISDAIGASKDDLLVTFEEAYIREAIAKKAQEEKDAIARKEQEERDAIARKEQEERDAIARKEQEEKDAIARKEQEERDAIARKEQEERDAIAKKEQEERDAIARKEQEEKDAIARKEQEERDAIARKEQAERDAIARKEQEERDAIAKKEQEEKDAVARKEKEEREAIARREKAKKEAIAKKEHEEKEASAKRELRVSAKRSAKVETTNDKVTIRQLKVNIKKIGNMENSKKTDVKNKDDVDSDNEDIDNLYFSGKSVIKTEKTKNTIKEKVIETVVLEDDDDDDDVELLDSDDVPVMLKRKSGDGYLPSKRSRRFMQSRLLHNKNNIVKSSFF